MDLARIVEADYVSIPLDAGELDSAVASARTEAEVASLIAKLEAQMRDAAKKFEFEKAAQLRDRIRSIKHQDLAGSFGREPASAQAASE